MTCFEANSNCVLSSKEERDARAIQENQALATKAATDDAQAKIEAEQNAAAKRAADLESKRNALLKEQGDIEKNGRRLSDGGARVQMSQRIRSSARQKSSGNSSSSHRRSSTKRLPRRVSGPNAARHDGLSSRPPSSSCPQEQQAAYEEVLSNFTAGLQQALTTSSNEINSSLRENELAASENERQQTDLRKSFEEEQNIALRLQSSPEERLQIESQINAADASGNLNAGVDALSGVVSSEPRAGVDGTNWPRAT